MKNSEKNTQKIKQIYDEFQSMENQFSTYQPNKTKEQIATFLKEINFFGNSPSELNAEVKEILY